MELWGATGRLVEDEHEGVQVTLLAVVITDGEAEFETARVAFNRERSEHPREGFDARLLKEMQKAERACDVLNELITAEEQRRAEAIYETRLKVREILGDPPAKAA